MVQSSALNDYESLCLPAPRPTFQNVYCSDECSLKLASIHMNAIHLTAIHSGLLPAAVLPDVVLTNTNDTGLCTYE